MTEPFLDPVWLTFGGRLHPLLLHLPIGIFVGLGVLELLAALRGKPAAPATLVILGGLTAMLSAASGWLLHEEPGYGGDLVELHEWLGIAAAAAAFVTALLRAFGRTTGYRRMLALTVALIAPAAHFGASMTHGSDYLFEPFREEPEERGPRPFEGLSGGAAAPEPQLDRDVDSGAEVAETPDPAASAPPTASYAVDIAAIFESRCVQCHGEAKRKGRLRLDAPEHILQGGVIGDTVVPGDPGASEMMYRLRLAPGDEDKMPPPEEPQPTAAEVALIEAWIAAGASFEEPFELPEGLGPPGAPTAEDDAGNADAPTSGGAESGAFASPPGAASDGEVGAPDAVSAATNQASAPLEPPPRAALAALRDALAHVQPIAAGSHELWIDFAAPASRIDDARARELLEPLRAHVAELSLARSKVTDALLPLLADMPRLARLDLRATSLTDAGLAHLAGHAKLRELVLARTELTDAAVDTLVALPALSHVWLWDTALTDEDLARLRAARPELTVDAGDPDLSAALELEPEPTFTSDAAPVDAPPEGAPLPINDTCPVSGSPVNAKFTVEFEGRVIGFCCGNCPAQFEADPERFRAKLP